MSNYSQNRIPGIAKIQIVNTDDLPQNAMLESIAGVVVAIAAQSSEVKFLGNPSLSWENSIVNGSSQEKATLEFQTSEPIEEQSRIAFVVTAVTGKQYLIGTREPKFPQITFSDTTGLVGNTTSVRTYKVTHVAVKSVLDCIL